MIYIKPYAFEIVKRIIIPGLKCINDQSSTKYIYDKSYKMPYGFKE